MGAAYASLILAEFNLFRLWPCLLAALAAGVLVARWTAQRQVPSTAPERTGWIAAAGFAAVSLALTLPPGEMLLGGWDPGVYLHTAAAIADHGSLQLPAQDIFALPEALRNDLIVEVAGWRHPFPGMFPLPNGCLSPQFMHLFPSLQAVAYALGGVWGALVVNPLLNVASILLLFGFSSRLLGPRWGTLAALLLAIHPAQVWQARFATAEILGQVLLLAGASLWIDAERHPGGRLPAVLAGFLLGLAFFTRYYTILFLVPLLLLFLARPSVREQRRKTGLFLGALAAVGLHAAWHMTRVAPCYRPLPGLVFPLLQASAALAGTLIAATRFFPSAFARLSAPPSQRILRLGLSLALAAFFLFAWYIRPRLAMDGRVAQAAATLFQAFGHPEWLPRLAGADAFNIQFLVALFGPFGLLLAFAGILVLVWRMPDHASTAWLLASCSVLVLLLTNVFHDHFMMWVSRRFIPVGIPLLVIGVTAATREAVALVRRRGRRPTLALAPLLLALVVLPLLPKTAAMASHRDWPGLEAWFRQLARQLPPDAIVFCDQPGFAAPLRFLHGVRAHEIHGGLSAGAFALRHRQALLELDGQPLLLSMRNLPPDALAVCRPLGSFPLVSHIQQQPRHAVPAGVKPRGGTFSLLALSPPQ